MDVPKGWQAILDHLKKLRDVKSEPDHHRRRHPHKPSPIVNAFARNEMKRRQCHKG